MDWLKMAKKMMGLGDEYELPEELEYRLHSIEKMIRVVKPQGGLESSQAVAVVVEQWKREQGE
jgi:hypothetical protein